MVFDPLGKILGRPVKDRYGRNEVKNCDVCGRKPGKYYKKSVDSYMCDECMNNHVYEGFSEKGWKEI